MNDLKNRIKASLVKPSERHSDHETALYVLKDCLAEIERFEGENLDFARCVEIQDNLRKDQVIIIERLEARIAELEKPYVPMTERERSELRLAWMCEADLSVSLIERTEAEIIKRYNEQRNVK